MSILTRVRAVLTRSRVRTALGLAVTGLAAVLVFVALVVPNQLLSLHPSAFVRLPVEGLVGLAVLLALPGRARRVAALVLGAALGLLSVVKILDMGFNNVLQRPFDPILDWVLFSDGTSFLEDSIGRAGTVAVVIAAILLVLAVLILTTLAVRRLGGALARHRTAGIRVVAVLTVAWFVAAATGVQAAPGLPVASHDEATLADQHVLAAAQSVRDEQNFVRQAGVDAFRDVPDGQLLTGLRGHDVILCFVESYGRIAIQNPEVDADLDAGTRQLAAAGFSARTAYLTSPTSTGASWLAHSTLLSGLWIDNQERYRSLVASDRLTFTKAFGRAGWRTVGVEPGVTRAWPEGTFYGYDKVYDSRNMGYQGPKFSWATMPDQYTLLNFEHTEYDKPGRGPLLAEITLVSSHAPWAPIPTFIDWSQVGDGSVYDAMEKDAPQPDQVWKNYDRVRSEYGRSIEYSVNSLISYVQKYGKDNLVLVFLGDHQPATIITQDGGANRDVPITLVAHDPAVLDRISGWGWTAGLNPGPDAPVWPMDTFRNRFLTTFGTPPAAAAAPGP